MALATLQFFISGDVFDVFASTIMLSHAVRS